MNLRGITPYRAFIGLLLALVLAPSATYAQAVPTRDALIAELRGLARRLADERERLEDAALDADSLADAVGRAQLAVLDEDAVRAVVILTAVVARPGVEASPAYGDALALLGDALWRAGLRSAGLARMRESLGHLRLPSAFRRTLATYLERAALSEPLEGVRIQWRRYQAMRGGGPLDADDRAIRYGYGKALYHGGAVAEAEALFRAIEPDDPYHLQATYFLGVAALSRGEQIAAREAFEAALAAWKRTEPDPPAAEPARLDVEPRSGGEFSIEISEIEPAEQRADEAHDDAERRRRRVGEAIHLALARLAAARGEYDDAWRRYRHVGPGSPDFPAALAEATQVLAMRGEFAWAARFVDQLLAGRGDDASAARLGLWKAQLLAQATRFDEAREAYVTLEAQLRRRDDELESARVAEDRLFGEEVLAWNAPGLARRARDVEAEMFAQSEALRECGDMVDALAATLADSASLPAVRRARLLRAELGQHLDTFLGRLARAEAVARGGESPGQYGEGPPATLADVARIRESAERLSARLARFEARLADRERAIRQRAASVLAEERPVLDELRARLGDHERSARVLAGAMRGTALENVETYAAAALFGQVDIAWWEKEDVSRRIAAALEEKSKLLAKYEADIRADAAEEPPPDVPGRQAEPAPAPAPEEAAPAPEEEADEK
jgi:tetratricopeptide (TPR) repeat protein